MMNTLKKFLKANEACADGYEFAKDLILEEFWTTCNRGDWMLWGFARTNPNSKLLYLAAGHCANTVIHLIKDDRGEAASNAEAAINAASNPATKDITYAAEAAANAARAYAAASTYADYAFRSVSGVTSINHGSARIAYEKNQKQTADICRKYLPLDTWNQDKINQPYDKIEQLN